jgi:hypothetical protein
MDCLLLIDANQVGRGRNEFSSPAIQHPDGNGFLSLRANKGA